MGPTRGKHGGERSGVADAETGVIEGVDGVVTFDITATELQTPKSLATNQLKITHYMFASLVYTVRYQYTASLQALNEPKEGLTDRFGSTGVN